MKFDLKNFSIGLIAAATLAIVGSVPHSGLVKPAHAAQAVMCQGDVSGASTGARTIGGVGSQVPSQSIYTLNPSGCVNVLQADVGYFQSQGYTPGSPFGQPIIFTTGVWTGTTDFLIGNLPAGAVITNVMATNSTANAVTGNISVGSTANGTDIVASLACGANCVSSAPGTTAIAKAVFAGTGGAATPLHVAPITAGNNANVTFTVLYAFF
jgi:hypothetical protein